MSAAVQLALSGASASLVKDAALVIVGGIAALTGKAFIWDKYFAKVKTMEDLINSLKQFLSSICKTLKRSLEDLYRKLGHNEASVCAFCTRHGLEVPDALQDLAGSVTAMVTKLDRTYKLTFAMKNAQNQETRLGQLSLMYEDTRANVEEFDVRVSVYSTRIYGALYPDEYLMEVAQVLRSRNADDEGSVPMYNEVTPE